MRNDFTELRNHPEPAIEYPDDPAPDHSDDLEPPAILETPRLVAEWQYRHSDCAVWKDYREREYPMKDREIYVGVLDHAIVKYADGPPMTYDVGWMIRKVENWADVKSSGFMW